MLNSNSTLTLWPEKRFLHSASVYDDNKLLIYGGLRSLQDISSYTQVWLFDPAVKEWTRLFDAEFVPQSRFWWSYSLVGRNLLLYGGTLSYDFFRLLTGEYKTTDLQAQKQLIVLNLDELKFTYILPENVLGAFPPIRFAHASATTDDGVMYICGGQAVDLRIEPAGNVDLWKDTAFLELTLGTWAKKRLLLLFPIHQLMKHIRLSGWKSVSFIHL